MYEKKHTFPRYVAQHNNSNSPPPQTAAAESPDYTTSLTALILVDHPPVAPSS